MKNPDKKQLSNCRRGYFKKEHNFIVNFMRGLQYLKQKNPMGKFGHLRREFEKKNV